MKDTPDVPDEVSIELFKEFLEYQKEEVAIKAQEIQSNENELGRNFELAKLQINIVSEDRKNERENEQKTLTKVLFFAGGTILILGIFLAYALHIGKDEIAQEIIKAILYIGLGGFSGYSYGLNKDKKDNSID